MALDRLEDGKGENFPLVPAADSCLFNRLRCCDFRSSSAEASLAVEGGGVGTPMDRVSSFGAAAPGLSVTIVSVLTTGGPEDLAGVGGGAAGEDAESTADGLYAIIGTLD